jgi:membrane-bound lytic murein transglycosylase D
MSKPMSATNPIRKFLGRLLISIGALIACDAPYAGMGTELFPRPPEIKRAVEFWTRIYSEVDSNSGFIHDSRSLDVVYEVFPLAKYASPKRQQRSIRKRIGHYQRLLNKIARTPEEKLSREELGIKHLWGSRVTPSQLREAEKHVRFQRGQSDRVNKGLKRAATYREGIGKILREQGVPEQLAALPHVESSYNPRVRSKAGAAGLWQIMPATGRRYLRVNNVVDERLDPYKSTSAAARLLKHNYSVLKSWPLAITAYNHGLSGVRRAVRATGTSDIDSIVQQYKGRSFKFASRNFYAAFLAVHDVTSGREAEFKAKQMPDVPVVTLNTYMPAAAIVKGLGVDQEQLEQHNPDLRPAVWRGEKYIPQSYRLHIPIKWDIALVREQVAALEKSSGHLKQIPDVSYRVQRGDNLSAIALRHSTSVETLMAMNHLRSRHRIRAGQVLQIPTVGKTAEAAQGTDASPASDSTMGVVSVSSDTGIARLSPERQLAGSKGPELETPVDPQNDKVSAIGTQSSAIPVAERDEPAVEESETMVVAQTDLAADPADYQVTDNETIEVQVGETLGHYALWLDVPTQRLRDLNGIQRGQHLIVGKRLRLAFASVSVATFENKRKRYHSKVQDLFFRHHIIVDVREHVLADGDNLWELSRQTYQVPLWLLRQYNPDLSFDSVLSLTGSLRIPVVQAVEDHALLPPAPTLAMSLSPVGLNWQPSGGPALVRTVDTPAPTLPGVFSSVGIGEEVFDD